jgi:hypothetical protein
MVQQGLLPEFGEHFVGCEAVNTFQILVLLALPHRVRRPDPIISQPGRMPHQIVDRGRAPGRFEPGHDGAGRVLVGDEDFEIFEFRQVG